MNIKINICLLLVLVTSLTFSQTNTEVKYDSVKAQKYGADEYGMKKYVMAFLKRGPNKDIDSTKRAELMNAHLTNIFRLADEGKLVLAGPFLNDGELRGIYIFDVENLDEAKKLTETDPAIQQETLSMELIPWYGTAALIEVNELSKTLVKKSILGN
ncbi:MAG: hypothetical protein HYS24_08000 [Ignavibacteriales bacterium]|nr:hypothetical protein [Ignavibacteriales bacterium]